MIENENTTYCSLSIEKVVLRGKDIARNIYIFKKRKIDQLLRRWDLAAHSGMSPSTSYPSFLQQGRCCLTAHAPHLLIDHITWKFQECIVLLLSAVLYICALVHHTASAGASFPILLKVLAPT